MTKSVTNQADPAAVPALASPDLATNIMRQLSHARLLAYDAADVAIYVLTENAVAGIIRDALHQEQNVMDVWQRTLADIIQKWTKEASCYVGGAMMDSPVGEMNRASATVIRAMLSDLKTLPLAVSRAGATWQPAPTRRRSIGDGPDDGRCVLRGDCASDLFITLPGDFEVCAKCGANSVSGVKMDLIDVISALTSRPTGQPKYPCGCELQYVSYVCAVRCPIHGCSMFAPLPDPPQDAT